MTRFIRAMTHLLESVHFYVGAAGQSSDIILRHDSDYELHSPFDSGILSGLKRKIQTTTGRVILNCIQTDATVNPGNSGGPLLNSAGEVIGMTTSAYLRSSSPTGVAMAIPVDTITRIADELIANGRVIRPVLGISFLEHELARDVFGVKHGVLILSVSRGSNAQKAGLVGTTQGGLDERGFTKMTRGDVIMAVDGFKLPTEDTLLRIFDTRRVGDTVRLTVENGKGRLRKVAVKLSASGPFDGQSII